ncbi:unnamed protein product, partial [Protopolystoma xenopodis]
MYGQILEGNGHKKRMSCSCVTRRVNPLRTLALACANAGCCEQMRQPVHNCREDALGKSRNVSFIHSDDVFVSAQHMNSLLGQPIKRWLEKSPPFPSLHLVVSVLTSAHIFARRDCAGRQIGGRGEWTNADYKWRRWKGGVENVKMSRAVIDYVLQRFKAFWYRSCGRQRQSRGEKITNRSAAIGDRYRRTKLLPMTPVERGPARPGTRAGLRQPGHLAASSGRSGRTGLPRGGDWARRHEAPALPPRVRRPNRAVGLTTARPDRGQGSRAAQRPAERLPRQRVDARPAGEKKHCPSPTRSDTVTLVSSLSGLLGSISKMDSSQSQRLTGQTASHRPDGKRAAGRADETSGTRKRVTRTDSHADTESHGRADELRISKKEVMRPDSYANSKAHDRIDGSCGIRDHVIWTDSHADTGSHGQADESSGGQKQVIRKDLQADT